MMTSKMTIVQNGRVENLPRVGRKARRPQYTFNLVTRPYGIYPFMIAPVLAGDTLKSALMQSRVVTDPVRDRLIGWWNEYYWFYVKLTDMEDRDTLMSMLINPGTGVTEIDSETANPVYNFYATTGEPYLDYVGKALERITSEYFRDEGETWNTKTAESGIPLAQYTPPGLWRSVTKASDASFAYQDVAISTAGDDAFTLEELEKAYDEYEVLRMGGFVTMTYDDYIAAQGVVVPEAEREEQHRPELLRFARSWQYPVSAINPTDGSAASAVTWSQAERIDKDRFFKEPGFIVGVTVCRPKVYLDKKGNAADLLNNAYAWLPRVLDDSPESSLLKLADNKRGINWADAGGVYVDLKDALLYGDQFFNTANPPNPVTLDTTLDAVKYPSSANIDNFFIASSPGATNARVRQDGICTLNILSRVPIATDTSRGVMSSQP